MTKSEIKKFILEEKENILLEIKESQKNLIKKEIKDEIELRDSEINGKLVDIQKKVFAKIDTNAQENLEAFRFMNERIKQETFYRSESEIKKIEAKIEDLNKRIGYKGYARSFIGNDMNEND